MCSLLCFVYYIVDVELAPNHLRYVYIYIHAFIHIYIHICTHAYIYVLVDASIYAL